MNFSKATFNRSVAEAVSQGFSTTPKTLPSWLFYDETGDQIFQQIMRMPEYYPTRCEYDILQQHKTVLLDHFADVGEASFRLIELGAGDGLKTEILLRYFLDNRANFSYIPVDISGSVLTHLTSRLTARLPGVEVSPINKTYDEALNDLLDIRDKKVILFMGANIGNFTISDAVQFLKKLARPLAAGDMLLIGFDLKKDPRIILDAYDDPHGLTARFNLNILARLNRELGATFNPDQFTHFPNYDPITGTTRSFLISMKDQSVYIEALEKSIRFDRWEPIHTEVSQKYDLAMIQNAVAHSGLQIVSLFYDSDRYFCDVLLRAR